MHARFRIASRLSHALALLAVGVALASPGAHAAERKHAVAKKHSTTVAAKRAAPRQAAVKVRHKTVSAKATRVSARSARAPVRMVAEPARLSFGQLAGLHEVSDPLDLKSSVALVIDQDTKEVLLSKNDHAVLPIASLTKLMTGLLISEARLPMDEPILEEDCIRGDIDVLDVRFGSLWTSIPRELFLRLGVKHGDFVEIKIMNGARLVYRNSLIYARSFADAFVGEPLVYVNSLDRMAVAINQGDFARAYNVGTGAPWTIAVQKSAGREPHRGIEP